jgi:hypothetical protein
VEERSGESEERGFLPPEPAGPEPELGTRPGPEPAPQQPPLPPPGSQPQPPPGSQQQPPPGSQPQAPPGYGYPPPPGQPQAPPPGYGYPPPPPGQAYPPPGYAYPPPWGYAQPPAPDNGPAVAGFVLSLVAGGLLFLSGGLSSVISIACAIVGIVYSRKGKHKVDRGETPKHRGLAQAGFIIGWVSLALAVLATIFWIVILIVAISDPSSFDDSQTSRAVTRSLGA